MLDKIVGHCLVEIGQNRSKSGEKKQNNCEILFTFNLSSKTMAKLRKPKPTPIVTTSNTSTVSALPSLLTSSLSRPASIAISETDFTSTFFDHLNQEDVGSSIHSSSKSYSKEDYLNTDITSSSKAR